MQKWTEIASAPDPVTFLTKQECRKQMQGQRRRLTLGKTHIYPTAIEKYYHPTSSPFQNNHSFPQSLWFLRYRPYALMSRQSHARKLGEIRFMTGLYTVHMTQSLQVHVNVGSYLTRTKISCLHLRPCIKLYCYMRTSAKGTLSVLWLYICIRSIDRLRYHTFSPKWTWRKHKWHHHFTLTLRCFALNVWIKFHSHNLMFS